MRFLASGPNFPDELLEARDAGNVVFFCGAGISSPALPGFSGLAEQVISEFGPPPGSDALAILNQLRSGAILSSPLDQVFNLLHQDYGAAAAEHVVNTILKTKSATAPTNQHSIVLRLSRSAAGKPQIVTTNFDRLFERAQPRIRWHVPPGLPDLASGQTVEGLVYLHGRMPTHASDGIRRLNFVLSSADFGRAYLADGWATRFVRELLQRYVIVLLGYSADDPPIRYLLQGLHARTDKTPAKIFAFDGGTEEEVQVRWRDRGVRVLSFENSDGSYSGLWNSLRRGQIEPMIPVHGVIRSLQSPRPSRAAFFRTSAAGSSRWFDLIEAQSFSQRRYPFPRRNGCACLTAMSVTAVPERRLAPKVRSHHARSSSWTMILSVLQASPGPTAR
jgi:SIR2-like domain